MMMAGDFSGFQFQTSSKPVPNAAKIRVKYFDCARKVRSLTAYILGWSSQIFLFEFQQRRGLKRRILVPKERI
jgi:hypothetical protein